MRSPWSFAVGRAGPGQRVVPVPLVVWLAVIWTLLWGTVTPANLLTGLLVGLVVCLVFPLPPLDIGLRLHPWGILRLGAGFLLDLTWASLRVSAQILRPRSLPSAVIAVPLRSHSDLIMAATTVVVSAVPGSTVVEVRRSTATLFVHVLDAHDAASLERARRQVLKQERWLARAFGTAEDIARTRGTRTGGTYPGGEERGRGA